MRATFLVALLLFCSHLQGQTWAEKLGFEKDRKVIILHADDIGMCTEANEAAISQLTNSEIQSAAAMVPCPAFEEFSHWAQQNPSLDLGLHLTLTSEWQTYRWPSVSPANEVPGLLDENLKMWHTVRQVVKNASSDEVETEIRAQIERSIELGFTPSHIDTHMGTLYGNYHFTAAYMKVAEEYNIPAMVIEMSNSEVVQKFRQAGYPITKELIDLIKNYSLPKLDYFTSVPSAKTYELKRQAFMDLVAELPLGLTEIIFHPSVKSERLPTITNSWQQRVWESQMFADPIIKEFFEKEKIIFTNWKEIMSRFKPK